MSAKPGAGEPLKLMAFQRRFIYGVTYHHESALTIARGNGKTTLTAAIAAAVIAGPLVVPRGQTVVVAASLGQAKLAFGHTKWFLRDIFRQLDTPAVAACARVRIVRTSYRRGGS